VLELVSRCISDTVDNNATDAKLNFTICITAANYLNAQRNLLAILATAFDSASQLPVVCRYAALRSQGTAL
jgi:hypothetical protein